MPGRIYGNEYRVTTVCVDHYHRGAVSGRLYHSYLPDGAEFASLLEFFREMEDLLDEMSFPQSFTAVRSFSEPPPRLTWLEGHREESFRSALELSLLMDSALRNREETG